PVVGVELEIEPEQLIHRTYLRVKRYVHCKGLEHPFASKFSTVLGKKETGFFPKNPVSKRQPTHRPEATPVARPLLTSYCLLLTAYCLLPTAYCLLPTAPPISAPTPNPASPPAAAHSGNWPHTQAICPAVYSG